MARKAANYFRIERSGTPPSMLRKLSPTNTPVGGDLCTYDANGLPQFQVTTTATAATQILKCICIDGRAELDIMNNPGYTPFDGQKPGIVQIGGRGSRDDGTPGKSRLFVSITQDLEFFLDCDEVAAGGHVVVPGNTYGIKRVVGNVGQYPGGTDQLVRYVLDVAAFGTTGGTAAAPGANSCVEVIQFHNPDQDLGLTGAPITYTDGAYTQTNRRAGVLVRALKGVVAL